MDDSIEKIEADSNMTFLWIGLAALFIVFVLVGFYVMAKSSSKNIPEQMHNSAANNSANIQTTQNTH